MKPMNLSDLLAGCNGYMFNNRAAPKQGTEINHSNISRKTAPASIASADAVEKKNKPWAPWEHHKIQEHVEHVFSIL